MQEQSREGSISHKKYERHKGKQLTITGTPLSETTLLKKRLLPKYYKTPLHISDCDGCYIPLGMDAFSDCAFYCTFCFSRNKLMTLYSAQFDNWTPDMVRPVKLETIENLFKKAFARSGKGKDVVQALRRGIPFHMGVLADCFQESELEHKISLGFLELCREYDYPVVISTKGAEVLLRPEYMEAMGDIADNLLLQLSFCTGNDKTAKLLEPSAPSPSKRIELMQRAREIGIRTTMRFNPIIPLITDVEGYDSLMRVIREEAADFVLMRSIFLGANKTVNDFFIQEFNLDLTDYLKSSGGAHFTRGCNYHMNQSKVWQWEAKAVNLIEDETSGRVTGTGDGGFANLLSPVGMCCGGDGIKGLNPHSYNDLGKLDFYNLLNYKYLIYKVVNQKKVTYREFFGAHEPLNSFHDKHMTLAWLGMEAYFPYWCDLSIDWADMEKLLGDYKANKERIKEALEDSVVRYRPTEFYTTLMKVRNSGVTLEPKEKYEDQPNIPW